MSRQNIATYGPYFLSQISLIIPTQSTMNVVFWNVTLCLLIHVLVFGRNLLYPSVSFKVGIGCSFNIGNCSLDL